MTAVTYFVRMRAKDGCADGVLELLLQNPQRIEHGEPGNLAFGVHRSTDDPREFWLYENWESASAVEAREGGPAFKRYKEALHPLVEPATVLFRNTVPIKVLGCGPRPGQRHARGARRSSPPSTITTSRSPSFDAARAA